ncbi:interleukin-27 subunit beta isoform X2 [Varanus komodoensis]|uniref:interleukin-27 subunit beta isoform X2 n=1 Tax=Varanus komodoensis TaxID=61221 RepID=UPI001CF7B00D|nr:interleukin-27 subunit beta isoform X2 [Varanus komodoensis]
MQCGLIFAFALLFRFMSCGDAAWIHEKEGSLDWHYARLGAPTVILACPIPEGVSEVEWKVNGTSRGVLARGNSDLVVRNASLDQEGTYSCHKATTGETLHRVHLKLGYPPEKLSIQCRSVSYSSINCSWALGTEPHLGTSFFSTYRHGMQGEEFECVQPDSGANSCSISNVEMFSTYPYMLNVTAVNPLGMVTDIAYVFLDQILKPDPPEDLKFSPIPGNRRKLLLEWKPPSSWMYSEYFPLRYLIRYSRNGVNNSNMARPTEQTTLVLTGIRPGATYTAWVAAKDSLDIGQYSDWSSPAMGTP